MAADTILSIDGDTSALMRRLAADFRKFESSSAGKLNLNFQGLDSGSRGLGRISGALGEFNKSLDSANARVIAFAASAGSLYAVQRAFKEVAKATIDVEKSLADVNVILGLSSKNLSKFSDDLFDIAKQTGQTFVFGCFSFGSFKESQNIFVRVLSSA